MDERVPISGTYQVCDLDRLYEELAPLEDARRFVHLDLSDAEHLSPAALAVIVATLRARGGSNPLRRLHYSPPTEELASVLDHDSLQEVLKPSTARRAAADKGSAGFDGCEPFVRGDPISRAEHALLVSLKRRLDLPDE